MRVYQIGANEAQQRLDKYLKKLLKEAPDSFIYKMMRKKNIVLNGKKCDGKEKLEAGDEVKLFLADDTLDKFCGTVKTTQVNEYTKAYAALSQLTIVYENEHILVVNKPAGVLSQKASPADMSVNEWLIGYLLQKNVISEQSLSTFKPSICNRLDRNTSGMVVCSKSLAGSQYMSRIIRDKELAKYYTCIVQGKVDKPFRIQGYLYKDSHTNKVTIYDSLERIPDTQRKEASFIDTQVTPLISRQDISKLEIRLHTGKTHQIRAHMASTGHPLIGDYKYGSAKVNQKYKMQGVNSQLLHACRLEFPADTPDGMEDLSGLVLKCREPEIFEQIINH